MTQSPTPAPGSHTPTPGDTPARVVKPGPRPGPLPGPRPGSARPQQVTPSPVPQASSPIAPVLPSSNPADFGHIDSDGTVYLTRGGTDRVIGSWQAGTPEEGLAHFGQRFADLATEVALLETRLAAHPEDAASIRSQAKVLKESLDTQAVLGDLDALDSQLDSIIASSVKASESVKEAKSAQRAEAIARKETLAAEAEDLAENSTEWKVAGDRIRAILDEWRTIRGIDRSTDDALWKRYSRARDGFNRRRGAHFADLDRTRTSAKKAKEELVERAEAMKDSTDFNDTARAYRDLMNEWKAAGRAPRDVDDKLWAQFRAAQDHFFAARNAANSERDREFEENAQAKDELLATYDSQIDPAQGLGSAKAKLRELQEKWDEIGFVPRGRVREYEDKIGAIEKRVADAEQARWRASDPAAQDKINQFQAKADDLGKQAQKALDKGNAKKAEELRAQAQQWQEFADVAAKAVREQ